MAIKHMCSECGNKVDKGVRICPVCKANFDYDSHSGKRIDNNMIEELEEKWKCPKCNNLNSNTTFVCPKCNYSLNK